MSELLATIRTDLLSLAGLRQQASSSHAALKLLFQSNDVPTAPAPAWEEVEQAKAELEQKVPGFLVEYDSSRSAYVLVPEPPAWKFTDKKE